MFSFLLGHFVMCPGQDRIIFTSEDFHIAIRLLPTKGQQLRTQQGIANGDCIISMACIDGYVSMGSLDMNR